MNKCNCNAPPSVTYSAVIYCLRCLVSLDIPLNQGCLAPIEVVLPPHSILRPSAECGVVGGNVLTSQRITDVILKALGRAAASQGCMNILTFGCMKSLRAAQARDRAGADRAACTRT